MQLSSLDITLHRINAIENQFQSLMSYAQKPDADFQKILDTSIENKKNQTLKVEDRGNLKSIHSSDWLSTLKSI